MGASKQASIGAASGLGATIALSAFRAALRKLGLIYKTAPMQVVDRLQEISPIKNLPPSALQALSLAGHLTYGTTAGALFSVLRSQRDRTTTEVGVGAALGVLVWGIGWAGWLPILGAQRAPWNQRTLRAALLPIADHALFGGAWALARRLLYREWG